MMPEHNTIRIMPDSELARFLDAGGETPVLLEKNGKLYRLIEEPRNHQVEDHDAEAISEAIRRTAGSWSDIDPDKFIADLYRAREEGSRPATRP